MGVKSGETYWNGDETWNTPNSSQGPLHRAEQAMGLKCMLALPINISMVVSTFPLWVGDKRRGV